MNKLEQITSLIENKQVVDVETSTEPKMRKTANPYYGRVTKHTAYLGVDFGKNYAEEVNRRLAEEGKTADFKAQKSIYEEVNPYFVRRGEQLYLRMLLKQDNEKKTIWYVDNRPASESEVAEIEGFLQGGSSAKHQGLEKGNEVQCRVVKIENVVAVGGETWAEEM